MAAAGTYRSSKMVLFLLEKGAKISAIDSVLFFFSLFQKNFQMNLLKYFFLQQHNSLEELLFIMQHLYHMII